MPNLRERFLQSFGGFKNGDGTRDSAVYLYDHAAYVDVMGDSAQGAAPAFVVRGLNNATNAPTELFRVNKDGTLSVSLNVSVTVGDLSGSYVPITSRNLAGGFAGLDASLQLNGAWFGNLASSYQVLSAKNAASGYPGLDGSLFISTARISDLSASYQGVTGRDAASGYPGLNASLFLNIARISDLSGSYQAANVKDLGSGYAGLSASAVMNAIQFTDGTRQTYERFGGTSAASSAAQVVAQGSAWFSAQAWLAAGAGRRVIFGPNVYDNMPQMVLPNRSGIIGAGPRATMIRAKDNVNGTAFILNQVSPDGTQGNAQFIEIAKMMIDGNKAHQTSGAAIYLLTNPSFGTQTPNDDDFDSHQILTDLWIFNAKGNGITSGGRSSNVFTNVQAYYCDGAGIAPGFDTLLNGCVTGQSGVAGFECGAAPNLRLVGCDAFYAGNVAAGNGIGFHVVNMAGGAINITGCVAQDNRNSGYIVDTSQGVSISGSSADSNGTSGGGATPGIDLFAAKHCNIEVNCLDRQWDGVTNTQVRAIRVRSSSINNRIRLTHWAANGSVNVPVLTWDANCTPNDVSINGATPGYGLRTAAFAAAFSWNPCDGNSIVTTLTASIALNAVTFGCMWPGQTIRMRLNQGAGGFGITPNAMYHPNTLPTVNTTASTYTLIDYQSDGSFYFMTNFYSGLLT